MSEIQRRVMSVALAVVLLGCTGGTSRDDPSAPSSGSPETQHKVPAAAPFALSDDAIVAATEELVSALDEGRVTDVFALLDLSDRRLENFNDCDFSTNEYFHSSDIDEIRERLMWIHDQGTRFTLESVHVGSGADPGEDVPSVVGAGVARFGPGLSERGHRIGWKLTIRAFAGGVGLFSQLPMTSPEICANPTMWTEAGLRGGSPTDDES